MCPTVFGRVQTRTFILIGPALLGLLLTLLTGNEGFIVVIGLYLLLGVALDTALYPYIVRWQPPWMTFVLALGEFVLLVTLAMAVEAGLGLGQAVWFFWLSWVIAIATKIVVLPILELTYIESGGEIRATAWSVPVESMPLPVVAQAPTTLGPLAREFSAEHTIPEDVRSAPSLSGVRQRPTGL